MTWDFHLYYSAKGIYDKCLCRYLLITLGLNLKISEHFIKSDDRPLKGSTSSTVDLGTISLNI